MEAIDKLSPIKKGLLELAVLTIISSHKVYVAELLEKLERTEFKTQEGTLYPLLSRLRRESLVEYDWVESDAGPPRKYYSLTEKGRLELKRLDTYMKSIITTLNTLSK